MTNDIFRTVRELLENRDDVLMGNAVNNDGKLYDDSVENLTAILAMKDRYSEMLAGLEAVLECVHNGNIYEAMNIPEFVREIETIAAKAKGN